MKRFLGNFSLNLKAFSIYMRIPHPPSSFTIRLRKLSGIKQGEFPIKYLGYPIYYGRKKNVYFEECIRKISRRILFWPNKFLSLGGKMFLVRHVLQSMPLYLMSDVYQILLGKFKSGKEKTLGFLGCPVLSY